MYSRWTCSKGRNIQFCIIFFIFEKIVHVLQNSKNVFQILISCFSKLRKFSVFSVFFASYHLVTHSKYSVSLQSETSETNVFFAISLHSFSLPFRFVSLPSEMWGHPNKNRLTVVTWSWSGAKTPWNKISETLRRCICNIQYDRNKQNLNNKSRVTCV